MFSGHVQWELRASESITTKNIRPNISSNELHTRTNTALLGANSVRYRKIERFVIINSVQAAMAAELCMLCMEVGRMKPTPFE